MTHDALRTILPIAGWPDESARAVEISGDADPILPTPFRLAASDLWELRSGRRQQIAVDTRQATASLRSGHYLNIDGAYVSPAPNAVMGNYPAKNGRWSYLHCNFPNHRAAALGQAHGAPRLQRCGVAGPRRVNGDAGFLRRDPGDSDFCL